MISTIIGMGPTTRGIGPTCGFVIKLSTWSICKGKTVLCLPFLVWRWNSRTLQIKPIETNIFCYHFNPLDLKTSWLCDYWCKLDGWDLIRLSLHGFRPTWVHGFTRWGSFSKWIREVKPTPHSWNLLKICFYFYFLKIF